MFGSESFTSSDLLVTVKNEKLWFFGSFLKTEYSSRLTSKQIGVDFVEPLANKAS